MQEEERVIIEVWKNDRETARILRRSLGLTSAGLFNRLLKSYLENYTTIIPSEDNPSAEEINEIKESA